MITAPSFPVLLAPDDPLGTELFFLARTDLYLVVQYMALGPS